MHPIKIISCLSLGLIFAACSRQQPAVENSKSPNPAATNETVSVPKVQDQTPGDITWNQIPKDIQDAAQKVLSPGDVSRIERQVEEGKIRFVIHASSLGMERVFSANGSGSAVAVDPLVSWAQLPPPVQAALQKQMAVTDLRKIDRIEEEGHVKYSVQFVAHGLEYNTTLDAAGASLPSAPTMAWSELPAPLQAAWQKEVKLQDVRKIERTAGEGLTNYVVEASVSGMQKILTASEPAVAEAPTVSWNELPKPVQAALQKELKPADIQKLEKGEEGRFTAHAFVNGIEKTVTIPSGTPLPRTEPLVSWNELPKPVQATFQKELKPADIRQIDKVVDADGKATFMAHARVNGVEKTLSAGPFGEWTWTDSLVTWNQLPKAVQAALQKDFKPADIRSMEKPAEGGAPVYTINLTDRGSEKSVHLGLYGELPQTDATIAWNQLPPAVQAAAQKETNPADVRKIEKPIEGGAAFYSITSTVNGLDKVLNVAPSGSLPPSDNLIGWNHLPPVVQTALQKEIEPGNVQRIERTEAESVVSFAVLAMNNHGECSITMASDGKILGSKKSLPWTGLPASIQSGLQQQQVKPASAHRIETWYEADQPLTYHVEAMFSGVNKSIILDANGKLVSIEPVAE